MIWTRQCIFRVSQRLLAYLGQKKSMYYPIRIATFTLILQYIHKSWIMIGQKKARVSPTPLAYPENELKALCHRLNVGHWLRWLTALVICHFLMFWCNLRWQSMGLDSNYEGVLSKQPCFQRFPAFRRFALLGRNRSVNRSIFWLASCFLKSQKSNFSQALAPQSGPSLYKVTLTLAEHFVMKTTPGYAITEWLRVLSFKLFCCG